MSSIRNNAIGLCLVAIFGMSCSSAPSIRSDAPKMNPSVMSAGPQGQDTLDSIQEFLITSAVSDFRAHGPSHIVRFRDVQLRFVTSESGETIYMLCGELLTEQKEGKASWVKFTTIKTSGYEQYLGGTYCQQGSVVSGKENDLSSLLQSRFDARE